MASNKTIEKNDVRLLGSSSSDDWEAQFEIELSDRDFAVATSKVKVNGRFTASGQRYFYGFNPEDAPNHWVFRLDFGHVNFKPSVDYKVGSGGFSALLIQGGSEMISGGQFVEGTMRLKEVDFEKGIVKGEFINVRTEGGAP
jgi:hypothetical protein